MSEESKMWHAREVPHYVSRATALLNIDWRTTEEGQRLFRHANQNAILVPMEAILKDLCQVYHASPKSGVVARPTCDKANHVRVRLGKVSEIRDKLLVMAKAADIAITAARAAFDLPEAQSFVIEAAPPPGEPVVTTTAQVAPEAVPAPARPQEAQQGHGKRTQGR